MSVPAITGSANLSDRYLKRRQESLLNAVNSGQAAAAQQALNSYRADTAKANGGAQSGSAGLGIEAGFSALVAAVQNGDLTTAYTGQTSQSQADTDGGQPSQAAQSATSSTDSQSATALQSGSQTDVNAAAVSGGSQSGTQSATALAFAIAEYAANQT